MVDAERVEELKVKLLEVMKTEDAEDEEVLEMIAAVAKKSFALWGMTSPEALERVQRLAEDIWLVTAGGTKQ